MNNLETKDQIIGARIKAVRTEQGYSQMDIARELSFESATAVSLIEKGQRKITVENLEKLATLLHTDIRYLMGEEARDNILDIKVALRADKDISSEDQEAILRFIDLAKSKK